MCDVSSCCRRVQKLFEASLFQIEIRTFPLAVDHLSKFEVALRCAGAEIQNHASENFCPKTHRIHVSSFIDVGPAVLEPWDVDNARTDGHLTGLQVISTVMTKNACRTVLSFSYVSKNSKTQWNKSENFVSE